jgi:hypothetical protein
MYIVPTGLVIAACNFGFCRKIPASKVLPDRGNPAMKWIPFSMGKILWQANFDCHPTPRHIVQAERNGSGGENGFRRKVQSSV